ncbi:MAG: serine/threonine protein kinase, partial [Chloroflexota bacterium]|nr:serine/threonine protein kinase [Chloroflexota bacterium]
MPGETDFMSRQIGNYQVVSELSRGGFGRVYQARHALLKERTVAIKLLHAHLSSSEEREQFLKEAQFLESLKHQYILPLLDVGFIDGFPYLITEYASGGSLRGRLQRQSGRLLPLAEAVTILYQVGQALAFAHQHNIVHRDLKPENILFNSRGEALLADFGIAVISVTTSSQMVSSVIGTPPYMSPEQFQGKVSKESDQYALGCIAYELFSGRLPFSAPDFIAMGFRHATEPPVPLNQYNPALPSSIEKAVLKALAKQRTERYSDVQAFVNALKVAALLDPQPPT